MRFVNRSRVVRFFLCFGCDAVSSSLVPGDKDKKVTGRWRDDLLRGGMAGRDDLLRGRREGDSLFFRSRPSMHSFLCFRTTTCTQSG